LIVVEIFVEVLKTNVLGVFIGANKKWWTSSHAT
jgi:hypothetical protein